MYGLKNSLIQEKNYLERIISKVNAGLKEYPEGNLRISNDKGQIRYYHCIENDRYGEYISTNNKQLPRELAQKKYNYDIIKKAEVRLKQIVKILKDYEDDEIEKIYCNSHVERQALIIPVEPTLEELSKSWFEEPYKAKGFQEGTQVILSERGERVRSKSEKILADYFYGKKIPYLYEKPLYINGYGVVYPDFTFYSKRLKKEIYWEHEGMMDNQEYVRASVKKINLYQLNGIFPGERLILTYETTQDVIDSNIVKLLVDKYLINELDCKLAIERKSFGNDSKSVNRL